MHVLSAGEERKKRRGRVRCECESVAGAARQGRKPEPHETCGEKKGTVSFEANAFVAEGVKGGSG